MPRSRCSRFASVVVSPLDVRHCVRRLPPASVAHAGSPAVSSVKSTEAESEGSHTRERDSLRRDRESSVPCRARREPL